jgi:hypothetical protein
MRHAALFLVLALSLSACREAAKDDVVAETQSLGAKICKFVPTAQTVLAILGAGRPELASGAAVAKAICDAISAQPKAQPGALAEPAVVAGVVVRGSRLP